MEKSEQTVLARQMRLDGCSIAKICKKLNLGRWKIYTLVGDIPAKKDPFDLYRSRKNKKVDINIINKILLLWEQNYNNVSIAKLVNLSPGYIGVILKNNNKIPNLSNKRNFIRWDREAIEIFELNKNDPLFMLGLGLYWGEGRKAGSTLSICNSDFGIVKNWLRWCEKFIPTRKLKYSLCLHKTSNKEFSLNFWKNSCNIQDEIKVYDLERRSINSIEKVINKMPNGVLTVMVSIGSTEEHTKMMKFLELLKV